MYIDKNVQPSSDPCLGAEMNEFYGSLNAQKYVLYVLFVCMCRACMMIHVMHMMLAVHKMHACTIYTSMHTCAIHDNNHNVPMLAIHKMNAIIHILPGIAHVCLNTFTFNR